MEDVAEDRLTDDDRCQSDDDGAAAHAHIGEPLVLGQQRTRQGHQAVGDHQAQHRVKIGVDALGPAHVGVGAGGSDGTAQLRAEEPIQNSDHHGCDDQHSKHRVAESKLLDPTQGDQKIIPVHVDGLVGFAQYFQVDGVEGQLGQDAGQNRRDPHKSME